jgi:hypothetical protein
MALAQQPPTSAGGPRSDANAEKIGIDREAAICHALCIAIEGSELSCRAQQCSKASGERGNAKSGTASAMALEQHARDAFQASMHLLDSVQTDKSANAGAASGNCEAFYQAAKRYSQALETCCRNASADDPTGTGANRAAATVKLDPAQMTLLNHAVKEAVEGIGLRKMIRHHHDRSETASALEEHAKHMLESSDEALRSVPGTSASRRGSGNVLVGDANANVPKRDTAIETTSRSSDAQRQTGRLDEGLPSLAVALIDAVKQLDRGERRADGAAPASRENR